MLTIFQYFWIGCAIFNTILFVTDWEEVDTDLVLAVCWSWIIPPLISICLISILLDDLDKKKFKNPFCVKRNTK